MKNKVDLSMLQKMYFENEQRFHLGGTRMFDTNLKDVHNITDFFYKYNHEDLMNANKGIGYVAWDTNSVPSSQAIRKLFPRPKFVMPHSEVTLIKRIFIEGPIAGGHQLVCMYAKFILNTSIYSTYIKLYLNIYLQVFTSIYSIYIKLVEIDIDSNVAAQQSCSLGMSCITY